MTWEKRGKFGATYFTKTHCRNGTRRREYVGTMSDELVETLARADRLSLAEKQAAREIREVELKWYADVEASIDQYRDQLGRVILFWLRLERYRRLRNNDWVKAMRIHTPPDDQGRKPQPLTRDEFDALLKRAELGSADAVDELRQLMRGDRETWRPFGDLTEHVKQLFLSAMAKQNVVVRESLTIRVKELESEFERESSSPVRKLAIDALLLSWLDHHYCLTLSTESSAHKTHADRLERRVGRAQKRFESAIETLARIDKLEAEQKQTIT